MYTQILYFTAHDNKGHTHYVCVYYICVCVWIIRHSIVCTHTRACASVHFGPCPDDRPGEFFIIMLRAIAVVEGVVNTATRIFVCVYVCNNNMVLCIFFLAFIKKNRVYPLYVYIMPYIPGGHPSLRIGNTFKNRFLADEWFVLRHTLMLK